MLSHYLEIINSIVMGHGTGRDGSALLCLSHSSSRCTKTLSVFVCLTEQADVFKSIPGGFGVLSKVLYIP